MKAQASKDYVLEEFPNANVEYLLADLSSQKEIRALAESIHEILKKYKQENIHVLINNAGAVTSWFTLTQDGYELQFSVNHLAPFLLTNLLLPFLEKSPSGRVLTVSSGSHRHTRIHWKDVMLRRHYNTLRAYKQSKFVNWFWNKRQKKGVPPEIAAETIIHLTCRRYIPKAESWYWKGYLPIQPSRHARREEEVQRLWDLSNQLCGLEVS
jgi:phenylpyruvate tautomerase PptA (4-oxalocrotonate tautomerase family)